MIKIEDVTLLKGKTTVIEMPPNIEEYYLDCDELFKVNINGCIISIEPLVDDFDDFTLTFKTQRDEYEILLRKSPNNQSYDSRWHTTTPWSY